ncbi:PH domain-containing protein [Nocardioides bruguierae]|uniref:PH domain-containing protein n=1 Tax=Nocardioides bruguierae TaxID=2945102 RepID=A0A9X2DA47_9ACTN|nr:PH domain-containing protein [Nocardioides bruguierae]MCL8027522.1 PH domain-containing protein [Nocardioides bruguierae]MCM0622153.1 PH domain-containing protein [Nocardioides bruguierae]
MPAASDVPDAGSAGVPGEEPIDHDRLGPTLPHTWRPLGVRIMAVALSIAFGVVFVVAWFTLSPEAQAAFHWRHALTLFLMAVAGLVLLHALIRCRVTATRECVVVVNGYRRHELAWEQVVNVSMAPGAPWVTLDLSDGRTLGAMGIQGVDGARAARATRDLRAIATELTR